MYVSERMTRYPATVMPNYSVSNYDRRTLFSTPSCR